MAAKTTSAQPWGRALTLAEDLSGTVLIVPAGSLLGYQRNDTGRDFQEIRSTEDRHVRLTINPSSFEALARQALKNKSGSARDGAISFRVVRRP